MNVFEGGFGPLKIKVKGEGKLFDRLCDELTPIASGTFDYDLSVFISDSDTVFSSYVSTHSSAKKHMNFNNDTFYYDEPAPYLCKNLFNDKPCELTLLDTKKIDIKTKVRKIVNSSINTKVEISYSLFWYIIQVLLLEKGFSFIHAGVISKDKKAFAFMGTGGSGKTSAMFNYLLKDDYKYLSEDFGIIDTNSCVHLSSKTLSIYNSDISNDSTLIAKIKKHIKPSDKLWWFLNKKLGRNPMIKLPIRTFFSEEKISNSMPLASTFYLTRCNIDEPYINQIDKEELAERMLNVTFREMKKLTEVLGLINANAPLDFDFPSIEIMKIKTKSIYLQAFDKCDLFLVGVPYKYKPEQVEEFLISKKIIL